MYQNVEYLKVKDEELKKLMSYVTKDLKRYQIYCRSTLPEKLIKRHTKQGLL